MNLSQKVQLYRQLRRAVYEQGTQAATPAEHQTNQAALRAQIENVCKGADLSQYQNNSLATQTEIWRHLWEKIQFAGIRTGLAAGSVKTLSPFLKDWTALAHPHWDVGGVQLKAFCEKTGSFAGLIYNSKTSKINTTIQTARLYGPFAATNPLSFVTGGLPLQDTWGVHNHLVNTRGYRGDITALHLMMDLGFPVIKPDIVVVSLFLKLGWLHQAQPSLPSDLSVADLRGAGKYGTQFVYNQKPIIYKTAIDVAMEIAAAVSKQDLIADIGWACNNPSRELDLFCVKFGQTIEPGWGLTRTMMNVAEASAGGLFGFLGLPAPLYGPNAKSGASTHLAKTTNAIAPLVPTAVVPQTVSKSSLPPTLATCDGIDGAVENPSAGPAKCVIEKSDLSSVESIGVNPAPTRLSESSAIGKKEAFQGFRLSKARTRRLAS